MWFADDKGFHFHTGAPKAVCKQLREKPKVDVCFYAPAPPPNPGKMMRVTGEVEFLDDIAFKTRLLEERPFLKQIGPGKPDDPSLLVFRIYKGEAHSWTMETNLRESETERIRFKAALDRQKGAFVSIAVRGSHGSIPLPRSQSDSKFGVRPERSGDALPARYKSSKRISQEKGR